MPGKASTARIATAADALSLLDRAGVMTLVPAGEMPSLVAGVVGGPIQGSWWGHAKGGLIFEITSALEESPEVVVGKLVAGKVAFVHRRLWPALVRVVTDEAWRAARTAGLPRDAAELLARVEAEGTVRNGERGAAGHRTQKATGDAKAMARARKPLEERTLVYASSVHTERGHHATVLTSWRRWATPELTQAAHARSFDQAVRELADAGIDLAGTPSSTRRR